MTPSAGSGTKTGEGLFATVNVIKRAYEIGRNATEEMKSQLKLAYDKILPKWNYVASPQIGHELTDRCQHRLEQHPLIVAEESSGDRRVMQNRVAGLYQDRLAVMAQVDQGLSGGILTRLADLRVVTTQAGR